MVMVLAAMVLVAEVLVVVVVMVAVVLALCGALGIISRLAWFLGLAPG